MSTKISTLFTITIHKPAHLSLTSVWGTRAAAEVRVSIFLEQHWFFHKASSRTCILFTGVSCQRCKALQLSLNTKNTSLLPWIGNAAGYRQWVWLQEYSSWEVDAIWLSLSSWLWLSGIDWWLIDRWWREKGCSMSTSYANLLFQSCIFCHVYSYHGGNFSFTLIGIAASISSWPEDCRKEQEGRESVWSNT